MSDDKRVVLYENEQHITYVEPGDGADIWVKYKGKYLDEASSVVSLTPLELDALCAWWQTIQAQDDSW